MIGLIGCKTRLNSISRNFKYFCCCFQSKSVTRIKAQNICSLKIKFGKLIRIFFQSRVSKFRETYSTTFNINLESLMKRKENLQI